MATVFFFNFPKRLAPAKTFSVFRRDRARENVSKELTRATTFRGVVRAGERCFRFFFVVCAAAGHDGIAPINVARARAKSEKKNTYIKRAEKKNKKKM